MGKQYGGNKVRIYLYSKDLNSTVHCPKLVPTLEERLPELSKVKNFSSFGVKVACTNQL